MNRTTLFRIIGISFGLLLGAIVAEIGFRFHHFLNYYDQDHIQTQNRPPILQPEQELHLGQIIQQSAYPNIIYELIPSSRYQFQQVPISINKQGFRDQEYPAQKKPNTKRIIGLGDSVMFGWGVDVKDCFLSFLERALNSINPMAYEVINTAVPGYNTVMEIATLEHKIDLNQVDLVIINFVKNDFDLPNFIQKKPRYLSIKKSFILQKFEDNKGFDPRLRDAPFDDTNQRFQRDPKQVPEIYQDMVGEEAFLKAMKKLKQLSDTYQFEVIVLSHSPFIQPPEIVKNVETHFQFQFLDAASAWEKYKTQHPEAIWEVKEKDYHPSAVGHQVIAEVLKQYIVQSFKRPK